MNVRTAVTALMLAAAIAGPATARQARPDPTIGLRPVTPPFRPGESCPARGGCSDENGLAWLGFRADEPMPTAQNTLDIGSPGERVCRAWLGSSSEPPQPLIGVAQANTRGCVVVLNGSAHLAREYELLHALPGGFTGTLTAAEATRFVNGRAGQALPANVLVFATFHGEPQALCIAYIGDGTSMVVGRVSPSSRGCVTVMGRQAVVQPVFHVMTR